MMTAILYFVAVFLTLLGKLESTDEDVTANKINCEYNVLLKLIKLEEKAAQQETRIESITEELRGNKMMRTVLCMHFVAISLTVLGASGATDEDVTAACPNKFNCEYNVLMKLVKLEEKVAQHEAQIAYFKEELKDAKDTIEQLNFTVKANERSSKGTTYIRWGRTTCPSNAELVYDGYVGGSHYQHSGTAANLLCLPTDPIYEIYTEGLQDSGRLYGAEYETNSYSQWKYLHDHDIPCAVCRIPRSDVLMVPGKNVCHQNYVLEYKGYLMSQHYTHTSSEFVCVDDQPEVLTSGAGNKNGKLFYFVESVCGSLPCPEYVNGRELTCAVCSFSPNVQSKSLQPYK